MSADSLAAAPAGQVPSSGVSNAPPGAPLVSADSEDVERGVNLRKRFFNLRTVASFLFGIAILFTLFRVTAIDPAELWEQFQKVDGRVYALAALSYTLTFPFRGLRWQRLLRNAGARLPVVPLTEVLFISWFVNSVLPGKLGDVYRGYLIKQEFRLSLSRTIGTIVAERVVDLLSLIALLGVTGYLVLRNRVSPVVDDMLHLGWIGFVVLIVGMLATYRYGERIVSYFPARIQELYQKFAHGTFASLDVRSLPLLAGLTALAWAAEAGRLYFVVQSLDVAIEPMAALFTVAAVSLSLIVPTPGGLGGVEAAFVAVLAVFGVPLPVAVAVALLDRLISYYSLIIFGFPAFLLTKRGKLRLAVGN
ncbi:MAG TPA: lysylphosphatidylglycerol synthase transmembrane domain-containing protein [Chloroflexota bacterium]|nr:lysylphosphatidylglycerol synthase transmembrane domain-containing protein [Chloroflexota bacterium]